MPHHRPIIRQQEPESAGTRPLHGHAKRQTYLSYLIPFLLLLLVLETRCRQSCFNRWISHLTLPTTCIPAHRTTLPLIPGQAEALWTNWGCESGNSLHTHSSLVLQYFTPHCVDLIVWWLQGCLTEGNSVNLRYCSLLYVPNTQVDWLKERTLCQPFDPRTEHTVHT